MTERSPKGYFIYYKPIDPEKPSGIDKKVLGQIRAMNESGIRCRRLTLPCRPTILSGILSRLPFTNLDPTWKYRKEFASIDFLYFRRPFYMGSGLRSFLKRLKKENPACRVIIEIPTYPYDKELMMYPQNFPLVLRDHWNRKRLKGLADAFSVISETHDETELWGIPAIPFANGVDLASVRKKEDLAPEGELHLIAVSSFERWHGYDRLLRGLAAYIQAGGKKTIHLHMVGDGLQRDSYEKLADELSIRPYVTFHGIMVGEELDRLYDRCHLACASFGNHRKGLMRESSLKSREYLAKGLPIIAGCGNDAVTDSYPYYLELPADESPVDFEEVVGFYDRITEGKTTQQVIDEIRAYATETVDMQVTMQPVTDYIRKD